MTKVICAPAERGQRCPSLRQRWREMDGENALVTAGQKGEINKFGSGAERKAKERQGLCSLLGLVHNRTLLSQAEVTMLTEAAQARQCQVPFAYQVSVLHPTPLLHSRRRLC